MIIKIDKPFYDIRVGILGIRHTVVEETLLEVGISNYKILSDKCDITEEFDIVLLSGVHYILPEDLINKPRYGCYCFHESPLPEGRGSAPIQWAVSNKRPNLTITMFKANAKIDRGYYTNQINIPIRDIDVYEELETKRRSIIKESLILFLTELKEGVIVLREQTGASSYNKKRLAKDSELDINKTIAQQWDLLRICDNENFPAFFTIGNRKVILTYRVEDLMHDTNN
jgi:methionyl-tRNA formyltransferase